MLVSTVAELVWRTTQAARLAEEADQLAAIGETYRRLSHHWVDHHGNVFVFDCGGAWSYRLWPIRLTRELRDRLASPRKKLFA